MNSETPNPDATNLTDNHVVGVINESEPVRDAVDELRQAGYPDPVVLVGEEGARLIDADGDKSGLLTRILSLVQDHLSEANTFLRQYEEEARSGKYVVAVEAAGSDAATRAQAVLERHGGYNIRFFGKLAVSDMTPQTNPSFRTEELPDSPDDKPPIARV